MQRQGRARGALCPPGPGVFVFQQEQTFNEPICTDKASNTGTETGTDGDSRQPGCLQTLGRIRKLTTSKNVIKKRGGKTREERLNRGRGGGKPSRSRSEEPSAPRQSTKTPNCRTAVGRQEQNRKKD